MIGVLLFASVLVTADTAGSTVVLAPTAASSLPPAEECRQTSTGEQCDIILRHAGPPERLTQTTDFECRDGFRFRLIYEYVERDRLEEAITISATTLRPTRIATVNAADLDRIRSRFDGANVASATLAACGVYEGTAEFLVTYFRIDWPQVRTVRYIVSADGQVDAGQEVVLPVN